MHLPLKKVSKITSASWLLGSQFGLFSLKTLDSNFLDIMYVVFMKNIDFVVWNKFTAVKLISASWAQKHLLQLSKHHVGRVDEKF